MRNPCFGRVKEGGRCKRQPCCGLCAKPLGGRALNLQFRPTGSATHTPATLSIVAPQFTWSRQPSAMPIACTFSSLTLSLYGVIGTAATNTIGVTLYKNGLPTSMTVSLNNPGAGSISTATDSTFAHQFSVAVGDFVSIGYTQTSSTSVVRIGVATRCQ